VIVGEGVSWDGTPSWLAQAGDGTLSGVFLGGLNRFFTDSAGPSVKVK
jgi:hypothetical protein